MWLVVNCFFQSHSRGPKMTITRDLVKFCSKVSYDQLPPEVIDRCKYLCLISWSGIPRPAMDSTQPILNLPRRVAARQRDSHWHGPPLESVIRGARDRCCRHSWSWMMSLTRPRYTRNSCFRRSALGSELRASGKEIISATVWATR